MQDKFLISIQGPTASGKTALAIEVAKWLDTEIISCDSRQFFNELKIGTAPPTEQELREVKHHFIHNLSVKDDYNAGVFEKDALAVISNIHERKQYVVMVGGSGLYADAVIKGFDILPTSDSRIRETLEKRLSENGIEDLQVELQEKDPAYYKIVDRQNPHRLIRALEVILVTAKPFSLQRQQFALSRPFKSINFGIDWPRNELYERINHRIDLMMEAGLLDEVKQLKPYRNKQTLNTVGYKELYQFLDGDISLENAIELIKRNSRRYAKRQMTWLRRNPDLKWVKPSGLQQVKNSILELTGDNND